MPELKDVRREEFARLVASGVGQSDAYERAGFKRNRGGAWRMMQREDVHARVAELRAERQANLPVPTAPVEPVPTTDNPQTLAEMGYTRAFFADAYRRIAASAEEAGQYNHAVAALGKIQGMYEAEVGDTAADTTPKPPEYRVDIKLAMSRLDEVVKKHPDVFGESERPMRDVTPPADAVTYKAHRAAESET